MADSIPLLPPELSDALAANGGLPIELQDPTTQMVYVLAPRSVEVEYDQQRLQRELERGLASLDAGRGMSWDPERIKRLGRESLADRGRGKD